MNILYYNITFSIISALFFSLNPPNLYLPQNNANDQYTNRSIQCYVVNGITDPSQYIFQIDTVPSFDSAVLETSSGTNYISSSNVIRKANHNLFYGTTYYWRVKVTNGTETSDWSQVWHFTTLDSVPLYEPANNSTGQYTSRSLRCRPEDFNTDPQHYQFEMDTTSNFNSPLRSLDLGTNYISSLNVIKKANQNLLYGTTYFWRVRVFNANDTSRWSPVWRFTTLDSVPLYEPANNSTGQYTSRSLRCRPEDFNTDPQHYQFEMDTTSNFNSPLRSLDLGTNYISSLNVIKKANQNLLYGTTYFWCVRVFNANDTSRWSPVWHFTTLDSIPLYKPDNNATDIDVTTNLKCLIEAFNTDYNHYEFEIDTSPAFDSGNLLSVNGVYYYGFNPEYVSTASLNLSYNTDYYWRARVYNANDTSQWSQVWHFKTVNNVGVNNQNFGKLFKVYPTPVKDRIYIELGKKYDNVHIRILDMTGKTLWQHQYFSIERVNIPIQIPKGNYFLLLKSLEHKAVIKFIKS